MLVLGRNKEENLVMYLPGGGKITIKVIQAKRDYVRLGIEAPKSVLVLREELVPRETAK